MNILSLTGANRLDNDKAAAKIMFKDLHDGHVVRCHGYFKPKTEVQVFTIT